MGGRRWEEGEGYGRGGFRGFQGGEGLGECQEGGFRRGFRRGLGLGFRRGFGERVFWEKERGGRVGRGFFGGGFSGEGFSRGRGQGRVFQE